MRGLIEALARHAPGAPARNAQKVNDFYRAYIDEAAIDKAGLAPVAASLQDVDSIKDTGMLVGLMGHWQGVVRTPLAVDSNPDLDDPGVYIADLRQSGLGLPDRDYYLKTDERFAKARAAYADYLTKLFTLSGDADAAAHAAPVIALETKIADRAMAARQDARPEAGAQPEDAGRARRAGARLRLADVRGAVAAAARQDHRRAPARLRDGAGRPA